MQHTALLGCGGLRPLVAPFPLRHHVARLRYSPPLVKRAHRHDCRAAAEDSASASSSGSSSSSSSGGPASREQQQQPGAEAQAGAGAAAEPEQAADEQMMTIAEMEQALKLAVAEEDYTAAAHLRDQLMQRRETGVHGVEEANRRFYAAFQSGDIKAMREVWGDGEHVQCIHPQAECIAGRDLVLKSWEIVLAAAGFSITLEDVRIFAGETDGWVTCVEVVDSGDSRGRIVATNVFERQGGVWKMTHHHGSPGGRF